LNHGQKVFKMIFITDNQRPAVLEPGKQPFDLPPFLVTPQGTAVLRSGLFAISFMRGDQVNAAFIRQFLVQVLLGRYRSGRSLHSAPVRKIQRMPSSTARQSCGGRPGFPDRALGFGIYSAIRCHCSFVRSICHVSALT